MGWYLAVVLAVVLALVLALVLCLFWCVFCRTMEYKNRSRWAAGFVLVSWILCILGVAGMLVGNSSVLSTFSRQTTVLAFAGLALVSVTFSFVIVVWFAYREFQDVKWKGVWISMWVGSLCAVVSFAVASNDDFDYGYGFAFEVLLFITSFLGGFFAFISDREAGNL